MHHERLLALIEERLPEIVDLRHRLHQHPEASWEEEQTAALLAVRLRKLGLSVCTAVAGTGIVADLDSGRPGRTIAFRADMDALPVEETSGVDWCSRNPGFSHCCGHDGHMAALFGVADVLAAMRKDVSGRFRFIFQPAEEAASGAMKMIEEGALENPGPEAILSLHAWPEFHCGTVGSMPGAMMASTNQVEVRIRGKGGHGARPQLANNPLPGMARVIEALNDMNTDQRVVSLCMAAASHRPNIIADLGVVKGTLRALDETVRTDTMAEIERRVREACAGMGYRVEVRFGRTCPMCVNDARIYRMFEEVTAEVIGAEYLGELRAPSMGSEDFGYFLARVPGLIFRLGVGEDSPQLHNSDFDFNDRALRSGIAVLAGLALRLSREGISE